MYLVFAVSAGVIGAFYSIAIRVELQKPGLQFFSTSHEYNVVATAHGLTMIFFVLMPAMMGGLSAKAGLLGTDGADGWSSTLRKWNGRAPSLRGTAS